MSAVEAPKDPRLEERDALLGELCRDVHIADQPELAAHLASREGRHPALNKMLREMGMDVGYFERHRERPTLIYGEQPGSWLLDAYATRIRILQALRDDGLGFDREHSGMYILNNDGFSPNGPKAIFNRVVPFEDESLLRSRAIAGNGAAKKLKGKAYSTITMNEELRASMAETFGDYEAVLEAAKLELPAFAAFLKKKYRRPEAFSIVQNSRQSEYAYARELHAVLQTSNLEAAIATFKRYRESMNGDETWATYWKRMNEGQFGEEIHEIDGLFNDYLLQISDPHQFADWYHKRMEWLYKRHEGTPLTDPDNKVGIIRDPNVTPPTLLGILDAEGMYQMVRYDRDQRRFFYQAKDGLRDISWDEVRRLAAEKKTGGPNCVMEYLLMSASDIYILMDRKDTEHLSGHDLAIHELQREITGAKQPWIRNPTRDGYSMLSMLDPATQDRRFQQTMDEFQGRSTVQYWTPEAGGDGSSVIEIGDAATVEATAAAVRRLALTTADAENGNGQRNGNGDH